MSNSNSPVPVLRLPGPATATLQVAQLWRYPVKSLLGERLPTLRLVDDGIEGDRLWGIQDRRDGRILTARREPGLYSHRHVWRQAMFRQSPYRTAKRRLELVPRQMPHSQHG